MSNQNKPRLSDVAKKNTTDRASKLVSGFLPPVPNLQPAVATAEPEPVVNTEVIETPVVSADEPETTAQVNAAPEPEVAQPVTPQPEAIQKPAERKKRSQAPASFVDMVTQPFPAGLRCDKPIMVASDHHKLLRELSFIHNKPMTEILYNLVEAATQSYHRDQQKDV